jgi:SNF2 family DNA or RNA helicase
VFIHNLIAKGTLDELVLARVETKATIQQLLLDRLKGTK